MDKDARKNAARSALEKVAKWRSVLAGWQLGTRQESDPECKAVRDQRDAQIALRVEVTALTSLLLEKGVIKEDEYFDAIIREAHELDAMYERKFPGFKTNEHGVDIDVAVAVETMKGWKP